MTIKDRILMWISALVFVLFCGWCFDEEQVPATKSTFNEDVETLMTLKMLKILP